MSISTTFFNKKTFDTDCYTTNSAPMSVEKEPKGLLNNTAQMYCTRNPGMSWPPCPRCRGWSHRVGPWPRTCSDTPWTPSPSGPCWSPSCSRGSQLILKCTVKSEIYSLKIRANINKKKLILRHYLIHCKALPKFNMNKFNIAHTCLPVCRWPPCGWCAPWTWPLLGPACSGPSRGWADRRAAHSGQSYPAQAYPPHSRTSSSW